MSSGVSLRRSNRRSPSSLDVSRLDLQNLVEEIEGLGRAEKSRVLNDASVIVEHLLKLQFSPAREPRNQWRGTIREHRRRLRRDLTPRLGKILETELATLYAEIRDDTAALLRDHGDWKP
jgi:hypothetical protein